MQRQWLHSKWMILIGLLILVLATAVFWQSNARAQERGDPASMPTQEGMRPPQIEPQAPTADCTGDDSYEDNDSFANAALVTPGSYSPLIVCDTDRNDYFAVNVPAGHTLQVELAFSHSVGNVDLYLYDQNGDLITTSWSTMDNESAHMIVAASGVYYVRNQLFLSSGSNNYSMKVSLSCADCITYQGQLTDSGTPANGDYQFQFQLYDAAGNGGELKAGPITRTLPVSNGLFTTDLYFGATTTDYNGAHFSGATYLEIQVRPAGSSGAFTILAPRQPLTAAPTAHTLQPGALISGSVVNNAVLTLNNDSATGLTIDSTGGDGVYINSANFDGVDIVSAGDNGVEIGSADFDGVEIGSAGDDGVEIGSAGGDGVKIGSAGGDGVKILSADFDGVEIDSAGGDGVYINSANFDGVKIGSAGATGVEIDSAGFHGVEVDDAGQDGLHVSVTGQDGLDIVNAGADGVQVRSAGLYAGDFDGDVSISGGCTGCRITTLGINRSGQTLQPGDLVASQGMADGNAYGQPYLVEATTAVAGQSIVGVVEGRAELVESDRDDGTTEMDLVPRDGAAPPGDYVTIVIYGPAPVKATTAQPIAAGERLAVAENGLARPLQTGEVETADGRFLPMTEDAPTVGIALEANPNDDGLLWVLVNPQ